MARVFGEQNREDVISFHIHVNFSRSDNCKLWKWSGSRSRNYFLNVLSPGLQILQVSYVRVVLSRVRRVGKQEDSLSMHHWEANKKISRRRGKDLTWPKQKTRQRNIKRRLCFFRNGYVLPLAIQRALNRNLRLRFPNVTANNCARGTRRKAFRRMNHRNER